MNKPNNPEIEIPPKLLYLGSLEEMGLGNPNGIQTKLAETSVAEREKYGERLIEAVDVVNDSGHYSCIDGRDYLKNGDESAPVVRRRQVSGTLSRLEIALNANSPLLNENEMGDIAQAQVSIEGRMMELTNVGPSAHSGGCGGANGAIEDNATIAQNPVIMKAVEAIMGIPDMQQASGIKYDDNLGQIIRKNAAKTAQWLKEKSWNGQEQVERIEELNPADVEVLKTEHDAHHGHKENSIIFVLSHDGTKTISKEKLKDQELGDAFVINLDASIDEARAMAGQRGEEGIQRSLIANLAKHIATANRLASPEMPIYFVSL